MNRISLKNGKKEKSNKKSIRFVVRGLCDTTLFKSIF